MKLPYSYLTVAVTLLLLLSLSALTVSAEPLTITTATLTVGGVDTPYTDSFAASGGMSPYTWKASGILPPGLSVSLDGVISGTPTSGGTYTFMAKVTDATQAIVSKQLFLTITSARVVMPTAKPAKYDVCTNCHTAGTPNTAPPVTTLTEKPLTESGTSAATFSFTADKAVSRFDCSLDGEALALCASPMSYTALSDGSHNFRVRAIDTAGRVETPPISYTWNITDTSIPHITTASLPNGTMAFPYNQTLTSYGGAGGNTWYISSGSLPNGLGFDYSSGTISSTPTLAGTYNFTVHVQDWLGAGASKDLTITIYDALNIITSSLVDGYLTTAYSEILAVTGGLAPYTWSLASGAVPSGLSLNASTGAITGTPTATGPSSFTVQVVDTNNATVNKSLILTTYAMPGITTTSLSAGTLGAAYSQPLAAIGGKTPYTWSITSGTLPAGLSLIASTGAINGTPTAPGTSSFTVQVVEANSTKASKDLTIVIAPQNVKLTAAGHPDSYYATLSAALGGIPVGVSCQLATRQMDFNETVIMNRCGEILTFSSAFDPSFTTVVGPTIIRGSLIITCGTVIADNLSII